jgi:hypothetical protein
VRRIAIIIVALGLVPRGAVGEPQGIPEATRLFDEARALGEQGKLEESCALFQKSYDLERAAGTMLNLGDCAAREGKYRRAWLLYDAAAQEYERMQKTASAKFAREHADALASKLGTIVVRIAEPRLVGLTVRIGDRATPPAAVITERLDAGPVKIVVSAPGRESFKTTAVTESNHQVVVEVPALAMAAGVGPSPPGGTGAPVDAGAGPRKRSRVYLAAGIAGAGVLGLAVSGVLGLSARSAYNSAHADHCTELGSGWACDDVGRDKIDDAGKSADIATAIGIGGGLLVVAGAVVFFTAPREAVTVAPITTASSVGLALSGRF